MTKYYGRYWVRTIGDSLFSSSFRQRNLGQAVCVTVIPADSNKKTEHSTPSLENIVGGVFHSTRNSKIPWEMLCVTVSSLIVPADPTHVS